MKIKLMKFNEKSLKFDICVQELDCQKIEITQHADIIVDGQFVGSVDVQNCFVRFNKKNYYAKLEIE